MIIGKTLSLEREMNMKTADIYNENLKFKRKKTELLIDVSSKSEELTKLKKMFNDKC